MTADSQMVNANLTIVIASDAVDARMQCYQPRGLAREMDPQLGLSGVTKPLPTAA
jgi:hypothetical protein